MVERETFAIPQGKEIGKASKSLRGRQETGQSGLCFDKRHCALKQKARRRWVSTFILGK